jgi:GNAT superfamily N-acetyltransferase
LNINLLIGKVEVRLMKSFLDDLSEISLIKANEANLYASTPFSYNLPESEVYKGDEISYCITNIPAKPCNVVFNAKLKTENVNDVIQYIIEKGRRKMVPLRWYVSKNSEPVDIGERLIAHEFTTDGPVPMLAVDLLKLREEIRPLSNFKIIEVQDTDTLRIWNKVCSQGFGGPPQGEIAMFKWFSSIMELNLPHRFFIATYNGIPVATSQLLLAEGVAGIDRVATIPEARDQGIGFAITLHPLLLARRLGYRVGTLQSSKMGENLYYRLGFRKCGEMTSYHWQYKP